jgi:hypothetical protein
VGFGRGIMMIMIIFASVFSFVCGLFVGYCFTKEEKVDVNNKENNKNLNKGRWWDTCANCGFKRLANDQCTICLSCDKIFVSKYKA